jgi:hypothetical protein
MCLPRGWRNYGEIGQAAPKRAGVANLQQSPSRRERRIFHGWNKNARSILKMLRAFLLHNSFKHAAFISRLTTMRVTPLSASA